MQKLFKTVSFCKRAMNLNIILRLMANALDAYGLKALDIALVKMLTQSTLAFRSSVEGYDIKPCI